MSLGENIRKRRLELGLALQDIADRLGTTKQVISRYERGERIPKADIALRIASSLGITIGDLTDGSPSPSLSPSTCIGKQIKAYRERRAMPQYELARRLSIAPSSICEWEADLREPRYDTLLRLCVALGCSPNDLLGWTESACPTPDTTTSPTPDTTSSPIPTLPDHERRRKTMIHLDELLELTNAELVICTVDLTPRLTATIRCRLNQSAELDDLSRLYGRYEITDIDTDSINRALVVHLRPGKGGVGA